MTFPWNAPLTARGGTQQSPDFEEDDKAYKAWLKEQGIETTYSSLSEEKDDHPVYVAYFDEGGDTFIDWTPEPPKGEGWHTFSIHDTEDGPYWVWARRAATALDAGQ